MKKLLLFIFTLISFGVNAQLTLLDEPTGAGDGAIISLAVYDNDILYTKLNDGAGNEYLIYMSNGTAGEKVELLSGTNSRAFFNISLNMTDESRRVYKNGNYLAGNDAYVVVGRTGELASVYKFNATKTFLEPQSVFKLNKDRANIHLIGNNGGIMTIDTINNSSNQPQMRFHHLKPDGQQYNYVTSTNFYGGYPPSGFFEWNNTIYFSYKHTGKEELYKIDGSGAIRVTNNKVSHSSNNGVNARSILLDDNIYFKGRYAFYTETTSGSYTGNSENRICYSNGDPASFGTQSYVINNEDDGSLGYFGYDNAVGYNSAILGKINDKLIYYEETSKTFYSINSSDGARNSLNIPSPYLNKYKFVQHKNLLYITVSDSNSLYIYNGNVGSTIEITVPNFASSGETAYDLGKLEISNNKVYFLAKYSVNSVNKKQLISHPLQHNYTISIEETFETVQPDLNSIYAYNKGLLFITSEIGNSKKKLYSWNIETRSKIHDPNNIGKGVTASTATYKYEGIDYAFAINSATFNQADKLKVQLLDTLSVPFKNTIKTFPNLDDARAYSKLFYGLNTLIDGNTHQSNVTLQYNNEMFNAAVTVDPQNFVVMAFYNNTWNEITPTSFDASAKTVTIDHNFPDEAFLFFKSTGTLSIKDIEINSTNISLFPNPAINNITVALKNNESIKKIEIYTLLGKRVLAKNSNQSESVVNVSSLSTGLYIVKTFGENHTYLQKLIIK